MSMDDEYEDAVSTLINMVSDLTRQGEYRALSPSGTEGILLLPETSVIAGHRIYPVILTASEPSAQPGDRIMRGTIYALDLGSSYIVRQSLSGYYEAPGTDSGRLIHPTQSDWADIELSDMLSGGDHASLRELQYLQEAIWHWPRSHPE